jgi:hypothetical protein
MQSLIIDIVKQFNLIKKWKVHIIQSSIKICEITYDTILTKDTNSKLKTTTFDVGSSFH